MNELLIGIGAYLLCGVIVVPIRMAADLRKLGASTSLGDMLTQSDRRRMFAAWIGIATHILIWPILFFFWPKA
jgi:hypothetical protein